MKPSDHFAPCGIDCSTCSIYVAAQDPKAAEALAADWRAHVRPDADASWFRCQGCRGDRSVCWSEDCAIWKCCSEDHGLRFCSECSDFACDRLELWAAEGDHHQAALDSLKRRRAD